MMSTEKAIKTIEYISTFDDLNFGAAKTALQMALDALKEKQKREDSQQLDDNK